MGILHQITEAGSGQRQRASTHSRILEFLILTHRAKRFAQVQFVLGILSAHTAPG